jgi:hypothetical protein
MYLFLKMSSVYCSIFVSFVKGITLLIVKIAGGKVPPPLNWSLYDYATGYRREFVMWSLVTVATLYNIDNKLRI